jgi:hypothetical protein
MNELRAKYLNFSRGVRGATAFGAGDVGWLVPDGGELLPLDWSSDCEFLSPYSTLLSQGRGRVHSSAPVKRAQSRRCHLCPSVEQKVHTSTCLLMLSWLAGS